MEINTLGNRLRGLRKEQNWTQDDVAERLVALGVTVGQGQIGHIEAGRRLPSIDLLVGLAQVFDTSTDYLLGLTDNQLSAEGIEEELAAGGIGGKAERIMARLSQPRREQVVEYANYLALIDQVSNEQVNNLRALQAVLNVMERSVPPDTMAAFWSQLAGEFPSLTGVLGVPAGVEQKRVNER
jgi:transcriptional regulator with XRE-family HTH domain